MVEDEDDEDKEEEPVAITRVPTHILSPTLFVPSSSLIVFFFFGKEKQTNGKTPFHLPLFNFLFNAHNELKATAIKGWGLGFKECD